MSLATVPDSPTLKFRISPDATVEIIIEGRADSTAINKLIEMLIIMRDTFPERSEQQCQ